MPELRVIFKVGDKRCAPGKEWASLRDGMIVDYHRSDQYWPALSPAMRRAFCILETELTPETLDAVEQACRPVEAYTVGDVPDKGAWRARSGLVTFGDLSISLGQTGLVDAWRGPEAVDVQPIPATTFLTRLKSSTALNPPAPLDINAIAAGTATIGTGGTYSTWTAGYADIANLTGNLTFNQISNTTAVAQATITENLAGNAFTCSIADGNWHFGNPTQGHLATIAHNSHLLHFECEGPGTVDVSRLRSVRTVGGATAARSFMDFYLVTTAFTANLHHNMYDGGGLQGVGIRIFDTQVLAQVWSNVVWDCSHEGLEGDAASANCVFANNTVYSCGTGLDAGNLTWTARRNACYANTNDFANTGNATGDRNQSDDATAANANWGTGTNNQVNGTPSDDFETVDDTRADFLQPKRGSNLGLTAPAGTFLAANTTDIAGLPWGRNGYWIGARARPRVVRNGGRQIAAGSAGGIGGVF